MGVPAKPGPGGDMDLRAIDSGGLAWWGEAVHTAAVGRAPQRWRAERNPYDAETP